MFRLTRYNFEKLGEFSKNMKNRQIILGCIGALVSSYVISEVPPLSGDVAELSVISIQGTQDTGPKISTKKLLNVAGSGGDPLKAIEALPGVILGDDGTGEPAVRGSSPDDNYYQTDYLPVGYIFHISGDSTYNPDTIEDFSLKAGAWDSRYSNANGAIIDTQLRDPYQEDITTVVDISFLRAGILVEGALTENSAFYGSWREGLLDWYFSNIDEPDEDIAITQVPKFNDYQFKYHYRLSNTSNLKFLALGARDHVTAILGDEYEDSKKEPLLIGELNLKTYYESQGIMFDTLLSGGTSALIVLSHKVEDLKFKVGSLFNVIAESNDMRVKTQFDTPLNNGDVLRTGFEFTQDKIDYKASGLFRPCNPDLEACDPASTGTEFVLSDTVTIDSTSVFTAYDWMATPFLEVTFGLNAVNNQYLNDSAIEPRITARYELNPIWTLTAAIGQHSQMPRDFFSTLKDVGNPDLDMPTSQHVVTGFEYTLDKSVSAKLEVYYKELDDLIVSNPDYDAEISPNELKYLNAANGEAYGMEFLLNKNLTDKWYGWVSLAYSKTSRKNEKTNEAFRYSYDRPWVANVVASYELDDRMTLGFKWRYMSGSLDTPISGGVAIYKCDSGFSESNSGAGCGAEPYLYDPIEGQRNSERLSATHSLDVRFDYKKSEMTDLYFEIIDVYGRNNFSEYKYSDDYSSRVPVSEAGTMYSLGAKFTF
jgi:outer membrane receptor protein involved in Fe transport